MTFLEDTWLNIDVHPVQVDSLIRLGGLGIEHGRLVPMRLQERIIVDDERFCVFLVALVFHYAGDMVRIEILRRLVHYKLVVFGLLNHKHNVHFAEDGELYSVLDYVCLSLLENEFARRLVVDSFLWALLVLLHVVVDGIAFKNYNSLITINGM